MHIWIRIRGPDETFHKMKGNLEKNRLHFSKGDLFKADYFRQTLIPTQIDSKLPL